MKKYLIVAIACVVTSLGFSEEAGVGEATTASPTEAKSFLNMKSDDWCSCGMDKLSKEERDSLQRWIQQYAHDTKSAKCDCKKCECQEATPVKIQAIKEGGKTIELADGQVFSLSSSARKEAVLWNVGDLVRVEQAKRKKSFLLVHVPSGKKVKAKAFSIDAETDSK